MLGELEGAVYAPFPRFFAAPVFAAESEFVQVFVGVLQCLVHVVTPAKPVHAEEAFVFQAVDLVLRVHGDGHIRPFLDVGCDDRLRGIGKVDVTIRGRSIHVVVDGSADARA